MSAAWVAAAVRARGLLHRTFGPDRIRQLEAAPTLGDAIAVLAESSYGRYVHRGMSLAEAERAIDATVLWHLRILAGWGPALSATSLRLLAGDFEIRNIEDLLLRFAGEGVEPPFELGALALSWSRLATAGSAGQLRQRLAASSWGDPGGNDLGTVRFTLRLVWASHLADHLPFLRPLAASAVGLAVARASTAGVGLEGRALDLARRLTGPGLSIAELTTGGGLAEPSPALQGAQDTAPSDRLWVAEVAWWSQMEAIGSAFAAASNPSESMVVGVVLLLAVDAWKVRRALQVVAAQGASPEVINALA